MKVTVIADDSIVGVDGEFVKFNFSLPAGIHAIQWDDVKGQGEIEYKDPAKPNGTIDDFSPYAHLLDERTDAIAAQEQDRLDAKAAHEAAMTYADKRRREYPPIIDQLEALYDARHGDTTKLVAIDAQVAAVKTKHPKVVK